MMSVAMFESSSAEALTEMQQMRGMRDDDRILAKAYS
jgi:hypothetical protein